MNFSGNTNGQATTFGDVPDSGGSFTFALSKIKVPSGKLVFVIVVVIKELLG